MQWIGIDFGEKRMGMASGDDLLGVASPLPAIVRPGVKPKLKALEAVVAERRPEGFVVGYPLNMDGSAGFKAEETDAFIAALEKRFKLPVHRIDERLTTHQVEQDLRATGGKTKTDRRTRNSGTIDSRAAALILQDFFEQQRNQL